jgi:DNA polymerase V
MAEEYDNPKGKRGGARPGAGRPSTGSKLYTFRAPEPMARVIDGQESKTDFIKTCIAKAIGGAEAAFGKLGKVYPTVDLSELKLPFFDLRVKAGFPIPLDNDEKSQDIDLLRMICPHPNASYLIRVEGDSMIDADIHSGDIIIVDKSNRNPSPSEVAVCELNGEYTLKHFEMRDGEGWLVPANPNYPEIRVTENDDFSVWGVVTYVVHKARG